MKSLKKSVFHNYLNDNTPFFYFKFKNCLELFHPD